MVLRLLLGAIHTAMAVGQLVSFDEMPSVLGAQDLVHGAAAAAARRPSGHGLARRR